MGFLPTIGPCQPVIPCAKVVERVPTLFLTPTNSSWFSEFKTIAKSSRITSFFSFFNQNPNLFMGFSSGLLGARLAADLEAGVAFVAAWRERERGLREREREWREREREREFEREKGEGGSASLLTAWGKEGAA